MCPRPFPAALKALTTFPTTQINAAPRVSFIHLRFSLSIEGALSDDAETSLDPDFNLHAPQHRLRAA